IAGKAHGEAQLFTRNGNDYTGVFPEIARAIKALPLEDCVLDGEVVCLDTTGKPSFSRLQQRGRLQSAIDIKRAAVELPATYYAFDLLALDGLALCPLQLADYVEDTLVYAGRGGTGFNEDMLTELGSLLAPIVRDTPPCTGPIVGGVRTADVPDAKTTTWVEPVNVCEVRFREWTPDGLLRHSTYLRFRSDKPPHDCIREGTTRHPERSEGSAVAEPLPAHVVPAKRTINFSNLK